MNKLGRSEKTKTVNVDLYHADWCHYCKDFLPQWQQMKSFVKNNKKELKRVTGLRVKFNEYNDKNLSSEVKQTIGGYPTIRINGNEFNKERNIDNILSDVYANKYNDVMNIVLKNNTQNNVQNGGIDRSNDVYYSEYMKNKMIYTS